MRILIGLILISLSLNTYAQKVNVACWSGTHLLFKGVFRDDHVSIEDGYIVVHNKDHADILLADCILRAYPPKHKKH